MEKYYIEISEYENSSEYILQSDWFDTEQEAMNWAKQLMFLSKDYEICLMSSEWDDESDTYTDIDCVRRIDKELGL